MSCEFSIIGLSSWEIRVVLTGCLLLRRCRADGVKMKFLRLSSWDVYLPVLISDALNFADDVAGQPEFYKIENSAIQSLSPMRPISILLFPLAFPCTTAWELCEGTTEHVDAGFWTQLREVGINSKKIL